MAPPSSSSGGWPLGQPAQGAAGHSSTAAAGAEGRGGTSQEDTAVWYQGVHPLLGFGGRGRYGTVPTQGPLAFARCPRA